MRPGRHSGPGETLQQHLKAKLDLSSRVVRRSILVEAEEPASLLPAIYKAAGEFITEASIRKPTLEDVFVSVTGHAFQGSAVRDQESGFMDSDSI